MCVRVCMRGEGLAQIYVAVVTGQWEGWREGGRESVVYADRRAGGREVGKVLCMQTVTNCSHVLANPVRPCHHKPS